MKYTIAVDIDLTVVDSYTAWKNWYIDRIGSIPTPTGDYNLVPSWDEYARKKRGMHIDSYSFWTKHDLYDYLRPIEGSVRKLSEFHEQGWNVIFVSLCDPSHESSKRRFVKKYFPFYDGFISTHEKEYVRYNIFVDDRETHINAGINMNPKEKHYMFTGVDRGITPVIPNGAIELNSWAELEVPFWSLIKDTQNKIR